MSRREKERHRERKREREREREKEREKEREREREMTQAYFFRDGQERKNIKKCAKSLPARIFSLRLFIFYGVRFRSVFGSISHFSDGTGKYFDA